VSIVTGGLSVESLARSRNTRLSVTCGGLSVKIAATPVTCKCCAVHPTPLWAPLVSTLSHTATPAHQHRLPLPPSFSHLETRKQRRREREKKGEEKKRRRREGGGRPPPRPPLLEIVGGGLPRALTSPELDKKLFPKPSSSSSSFGGPKVDLPPQASPSHAAAVGDRP